MSNQTTLILFFTAGTCLFLLFSAFIIYFFLIYKRSQYAHKLEKQRLENEKLQVKIAEQENVFSSISQELHDNIKSKLGTGQFNLYRIQDISQDQKQQLFIKRLEGIFIDVIREVDTISRSLNTQFLNKISLADALQEKLDSLGTTKSVIGHLEIVGTQYDLPDDSKLHVYRIAQEAIQNSVKHARATNVSVRLRYSADMFSMSICDDGHGFDMTDRQGTGGLGFINMYERARYINGALTITSEPNNGCTISLTLNLPTHEKENTK